MLSFILLLTAKVNAQEVENAQKAFDESLKVFEKEFSDVDYYEIEVDYENENHYQVTLHALKEKKDIEIDYRFEEDKLTEKEREIENENEDDPTFKLDKVISLTEAHEIAVKEAKLDQASSWKLAIDDDDQDGKLVWKIEFDEDDNNGAEATIKIDALTGELIEVDKD